MQPDDKITVEDAGEQALLRISGRAPTTTERRLAVLQTHAPRPAAEHETEAEPIRIEERRRCERLEISIRVDVRRVGSCTFRVTLKDISRCGCMFEMLELCRPDDSVIARFPNLEPLGSRICWTNGRTAGLQFQTSVHPAVFDMLITRLSAGTSRAA